MKPKTGADDDGQSKLGDRSCGGRILCIEEILSGHEKVGVSADFAPRHSVQHEEASERKLVLVVIELLACHTAIDREADPAWILVAGLGGQDMMRHARDPYADQCWGCRKAG